MKDIPSTLQKYSESPLFDHDTVPRKLTTSHKVKEGTWAKVVVREGALNYILADAPERPFRVEAGSHAVIEPDVEHWVEIVGSVSFIIEFYRDDKAA